MVSSAKPRDAGDAGNLRIGEVASRLGVSTHTLRAWERRHGLIKPSRTQGEERRYSAEDVERLGLVKRLSDFGYALADVAAQSTEQLRVTVDRLESYRTRSP